MKHFNGLKRGFCVSVILLGLCTLSGCGVETAEGGTQAKKDFQVAVQEKSEASQSSQNGEEDADSDAKGPTTMADLLSGMGDEDGTGDGEALADTVLWFNATYAPLTYSNGMDWRLVGGMEPSAFNESLNKVLLSRDWNVEDRESAIDTLEWLREEGHRATYRKYLEELEDLGLLDVDADTFMEALTNSEMEGYLFRYVIVYSMYQYGMDEEVIAAWDLCRFNQLCGDYYICGYMTYEEAMDASLENSLVLQEMYSSWDELMESYMLGYQFWQSDPALTEDSPTMQRYHYYEILLEMEDGPYSLDWDMELKKDW